MRFQEILAEYHRSKTAEKLGGSIAQRSEKDPELSDLEPEQQIDRVLERAESADPTPNKKYVTWIIRQFVKNGLRLEDINEFLRNDIQDFHELPQKRKQQLNIHTDINRYTWHDIREIATKLKKATDLEEPVDAKLDYEHIDDMKVLYVGDMGELIIPETEAASCEIGSGTRWCTSATESDNRFDYYSSMGPLYVWIPSRKMPEKKQSNKFQFHFSEEDFQFMDENDERINSELLQYFRTEHPILKKVFAKNEKEIKQDPEKAYFYADGVIGGRFPEAEDVIKQSQKYAHMYARDILKGRWPEAEDVIKQKSVTAYKYANQVIGDRWPEGEKAIIKNPTAIIEYAKDVIGGRWPEAEDVIKQDPDDIVSYADHVINGRWPEGEKILLQYGAEKIHQLYRYARYVIKGRWPEAEKILLQYGAKKIYHLYSYTRHVIKGRWPEAEQIFKHHPEVWGMYSKIFDVDGEVQEDVSSASGEEYDELTQKNFAHKSQQVVDLAKQSKQALQAFYPNGELKTMRSGTGNFVTQWYETPETIFLIGINTKSRRLLKNDIADVKTFIDMLITAMQSGKTLITSPHKKSLSMLKNVQKIAEKRGLNFSMDVSDGISFGENDPELEFFQVQAEIN